MWHSFLSFLLTADDIFLLQAKIHKVNLNGVGVIFDYQRAFDTVNKDAMWVELLNSAISCKMKNMIK